MNRYNKGTEWILFNIIYLEVIIILMCLYFLTVNASAATPDEPDEKQETAEDVLAKVQWLKDNCAPTTKVKEYMSLHQSTGQNG